MIHLEQAVIVEGKYDKIRLSAFLDALIITTDGFGIFKNKQKRQLIRRLAEKRGVVIMTDSDSAGFLIRSHIKSFVPGDRIVNVYLPDILGKERRKAAPSKEGKLGVEGMSEEVITEAIRRAGLTDGAPASHITRMMLYEDGFIGGEGSAERRKRLKKELSLPENLTSAQLPQVLGCLLTQEEYRELADRLREP